ncbi:MAG TPA: TIGR04283 family arsenosugar biosynthesis glycosyltransferase [Desulfuromonadaceae bacterium]
MTMQRDQTPELSIIVPVLDESAELAALFENLSCQRGVCFELILCDGGSRDATPSLAAELAATCPFILKSTLSQRGRGRQMNAGAALAAGELLLFLHADSRFPEAFALSRAVAAFRNGQGGSSSHARAAARFSLTFRRSDDGASLAYCYYEAKARLNRSDCIRGDQGFLLSREFFRRLGGFDTSLPFFEDVTLGLSIARQGTWMLLPAEITTSARRFEAEGLCQRQVVNAIIVNAAVTGWTEFFSVLPGLYRCHAETGRLLLFPLMTGIRTLLGDHDRTWRRTFWRATGRHVAANAWQLFFWLDVRRTFRAGGGPAAVEPRCLDFYRRRLAWLFQGAPAALAAAALVRFWFGWLCLRGGLQRRS